jgi:hypothetical protein
VSGNRVSHTTTEGKYSYINRIVTKHDHYDQYPHVFWIFDNLQMTALFVENLITGIKWVVSSMNGN